MKIKFQILQNVVIYMIKYVQQKKKLNLLIIEIYQSLIRDKDIKIEIRS